jgi:NAD-dependent DNA ligase
MIEHSQVEKEKIVQASKLIQSLKHPEKVAKKPVTRDSIIDPGYLQRSGLTSTPSALEVRSNSELKLLAKSLLSGSKRNIALTGTPSMGKESFAQMALKIGFEYSRNPVGKRYTALLVVGIAETGQTKIHDANQNGVPVVNDSEWIALNLLLQELQRI